ncbi:isochorismatase family protein [Vibrio sp. Of14-4]|uniref:isochorismatase family protein n=1 Tax=Vibrio sp. Of14-4 TaxID=2724878 RepID=UPI001EF3496E|nr:isochorismatase family protein [Vibrio sp. Of14-4]MCG7488015.1 isochorismatase family protein [Vibrio sp. Of14-4]
MPLPTNVSYPMPTRTSFLNKTDWQLEANRAVLLIHDMQRYFVDIYESDSVLLPTLLGNIAKIKEWAKQKNIPVVYTQITFNTITHDHPLIEDFWGFEEIPPCSKMITSFVAPEEGDILIDKSHYSAMQSDELAQHLKELGRDQLLITGLYANLGCRITVTDALKKNIQAFLVSDAIADLSYQDHLNALNYVANYTGYVINTQTVLEPKPVVTYQWLCEKVNALLDDAKHLDPEKNLINCGFDSLRMIRLITELNQLGININYQELSNDPCLTSWWAILEEKRSVIVIG